MAGGTAQLGPSVLFENPVAFKGRGTVIVEAQVTLGYRNLTAEAEPIMLQPRSPEARILIAAHTHITNGVEIIAVEFVSIGQRCLIGPRTVIMDSDFHGVKPDERNQPGLTRPIVIDDNVWIGTQVTILKGVTVGRDAVLGTQCVVARDVPPGAIVVGNPMRIVGTVYDR